MNLQVVAAVCTFVLSNVQTEGFLTVPSSNAKASRTRKSLSLKLQSAFNSRSTCTDLYSSLQEETSERTYRVNGNAKDKNGMPADAASSQTEDETFTWTKQWYPVLPESYLPDDKPTPITILGQDLVIWKTTSADGKTSTLSVLDDSCPHRRAPLSTGKIVDDGRKLACRYHGWEFDASGSCTKIPMDATQKYANAFCTQSYPAQIKGGLVWIYMDPNAASPPPVPQEIVNSEENTDGWMMYVSPVSFLSQIENSFDPTHAPFTHEGPGFGPGYSPDNAIPIERYELTSPVTDRGFALEHTPYQKSAPGMAEVTTTRQYVPPCTSVTKSPFFSANLHFVPSRSGETIVLAQFGGGGARQKKNMLSRFVPQRVKVVMKDFIHFWFQLSGARYKFLMQDQINMQGQDARKVKDKKWDDVTPTPSDAGVKAFQRWIRRYGASGPFPLAELSAHAGKELSMWESHGKYCRQCQATIKRLARLEKAMKKVSAVSMLLSLGGAAISSLLPFARRNARSSAGLLAFSFLVLSFASRALSQSCARLMERSFVTRESDAHLQTMEIYPN